MSLLKNKNTGFKYYSGLSWALIVIAYVFFFIVIPVSFGIFDNRLPYLQTLNLKARLEYSLIASFLIFITYLFVSINKESNLVVKRWRLKEILMAAVGSALFIWMIAEFSGNTFAVFVKAFPNKIYLEQHKVVEVKSEGSKMRYINFTFKSVGDGKITNLAISNILFSYRSMPKPQVGDHVYLHGKQNIFGVYVEDLTIHPKNTTLPIYKLSIAWGDYIFVMPALLILSFFYFCYYVNNQFSGKRR